MICLPEAAEAVAVAGVAECAVVAVAERVAVVAAAPFAVAEEGVPQWGAHLPCRDLPHLDPQRVGHPAAASPAVEGRARGPAVAVDPITVTCRRPAVGQDPVPVVPAAEIWRVAERDPVAHVPVEYSPAAHDLAAHDRVEYNQAARGLAVAAWRVAALALAPVRGPAVVRRQAIWETFLISPARAAAVHIVLELEQRLRAAPQRSLPVVPQPISCKTDCQLSRVLNLACAQVPATLHRHFRRGLAKAEVEFNVPRHYQDKMVVEFNDRRHGPDKMGVESNVPRHDRGKTAVAFSDPPHVRARTVAVFSDPRRDLARMAVAFSDLATATDHFDPIRFRPVPVRAAVVFSAPAIGRIDPAAAIGRTIDLIASMIGTNGTIGARTITLASTTIGITTGATMTTGLITTGGTITTTFIGIMAPASITGVGLPGRPSPTGSPGVGISRCTIATATTCTTTTIRCTTALSRLPRPRSTRCKPRPSQPASRT